MKAFVIAGGLPQIELIKQLKARGITTVLADGNENAIARPYADVFYRIPIFDIEAVKEVAVREQVDFIITVCADQVLLVVAQVSEMLGLPCYLDYETAQNVSDKLKMKAIFKANGIPTSNYLRLERFDPEALSALRFPLVVKPVDAYSSKGVRRAENLAELELFYKEAEKISRSGGVIVEEYCEGEEISVDAFVTNGKVKLLCVSNSDKIKDEGRFVIFRGRWPVHTSEIVLKKIEETAQKIADAFGLVNCPLLIQLIDRGDDISVLEFCARTGGNLKWLLIKYSCGVDVISAAIDLSLGIQPVIEPAPTGNAIVVNDFIYCRPGVFDRLEGFEELKEQGLLREYFALRPVGMRALGVSSSSDRIAGITMTAGSVEEFNEKHRKVVGTVKILDPEGNDIMRHDLLPDLQFAR
ncbi:MAG: ATP-grasp domain-containing protein [Oscillospiraceae bacterium]|nr:ATP-grasp domain-containing protein [Oscillospiraceae bacterium]